MSNIVIVGSWLFCGPLVHASQILCTLEILFLYLVYAQFTFLYASVLNSALVAKTICNRFLCEILFRYFRGTLPISTFIIISLRSLSPLYRQYNYLIVVFCSIHIILHIK